MTKKLSFQTFIISQLLILISGLTFLGVLYYLINSPSTPGPSKTITLGKDGPLTREPASLNLDLNTPDDDTLTFKDEIEFSGKTSADSQVLITSADNDLVVASEPNGTFSADFELAEGINEIKVIVFDQNGDQKELERTVYFSKEKI